VPFCQEHVLAIWVMVDQDMRSGETPPADVERRTGQRDRKAAGTIYFLLVASHIKIGYTQNLHQRIGQYPPNAELLATHPGTPTDERQLHQRFAAYLDSGREWFRDVPEIREHIELINEGRGSPRPPVRRVRRRPTPARVRTADTRRVG
jgi:hypothetical protein